MQITNTGTFQVVDFFEDTPIDLSIRIGVVDGRRAMIFKVAQGSGHVLVLRFKNPEQWSEFCEDFNDPLRDSIPREKRRLLRQNEPKKPWGIQLLDASCDAHTRAGIPGKP